MAGSERAFGTNSALASAASFSTHVRETDRSFQASFRIEIKSILSELLIDILRPGGVANSHDAPNLKNQPAKLLLRRTGHLAAWKTNSCQILTAWPQAILSASA